MTEWPLVIYEDTQLVEKRSVVICNVDEVTSGGLLHLFAFSMVWTILYFRYTQGRKPEIIPLSFN